MLQKTGCLLTPVFKNYSEILLGRFNMAHLNYECGFLATDFSSTLLNNEKRMHTAVLTADIRKYEWEMQI